MLTQRYSELMRYPLRQQVLRVFQFLLAMGILMGFFTFVFKLEISRPVLFGPADCRLSDAGFQPGDPALDSQP